jgi:alpha-tubulin suppressor-like RCC1 family protein
LAPDHGGVWYAGVKNDGSLWAWGYNGDGRLGVGDTSNRSSPVQVGSDTNWKTVSLAYDTTYAIKNNGTLWAWGNNGYGQIGVGDTGHRSSPVQVGTDTNWSTSFTSISSQGLGYIHAIKNNGTLWAWGGNNCGQLGDGTTTYRSSPVQIGAQDTWSKVVAGLQTVYAIKNDGTMWAWGNNDNNGALGNGTVGSINSCSSPVQIGMDGINDWKSVSYSGNSIHAIKNDGTLWAWSYFKGGVGIGDASAPVQIGNSGVFHAVLPKMYFWSPSISGVSGYPVITNLGNVISYYNQYDNNYSTVYSGGGASRIIHNPLGTLGGSTFLIKNVI